MTTCLWPGCSTPTDPYEDGDLCPDHWDEMEEDAEVLPVYDPFARFGGQGTYGI